MRNSGETGSRTESKAGSNHVVQRQLLIVDDSAAVLETTRSLFSGTHWSCQTCADTISALCAIVELQPQAVLVGSESGPLQAWQFCSLIKTHQRYKHIPVLILEKQQDMISKARACAAGADGCVFKPFTAEEVIEHLDNLTGTAR